LKLSDIILNTNDLPCFPFPTPEWPEADGKVFIRALNGEEQFAWEQTFVPSEKRILVPPCDNYLALVAGYAMVDGTGERIFSDEQIRLLKEKNSNLLARAYDAIMRLSKIRYTKEEFEDAKKNCEKTIGNDLSTD